MKASYKIALLLSALIMGGSVVFWAQKKKGPGSSEPITMTAELTPASTDSPVAGLVNAPETAPIPTPPQAPAATLAPASITAAEPVAAPAAAEPLGAPTPPVTFPTAVAEGPLVAPTPVNPSIVPAAPLVTNDQEGVPGGIWTVKPGDIPGNIAKKVYGSTLAWSKIAEANPGVNPNNVKVGTKLKLPVLGGTATAATAAVPSPSNSVTPVAPVVEPAAPASRTYKVKPGDSLSTIAQKFYGKQTEWKKIADANPSINPNALKLGTELKIP